MKITGIVYIKVDGALLQSKDGAKLTLGGYMRTAQMGHSLYGFSQKFETAKVECTISHDANTDLPAMAAWNDVTLIFETDTGVSYTVGHAALTKSPVLTGGDGDVALEFEGQPAVQS